MKNESGLLFKAVLKPTKLKRAMMPLGFFMGGLESWPGIHGQCLQAYVKVGPLETSKIHTFIICALIHSYIHPTDNKGA